MDKWILRDAERYASAHRRKQRWYQVMTCLAAVVVFCTTYALILPAITLEKQCQIPEHTHTDSCYTQVTSREKSVLACEVEADAVIHAHDAACRDENGNLVCSLPELEAHRHTDSCYTIPEVHAHTEACYTRERGALTCTQSTEPQHIHTEDCYQESSDLVCGTSESTGHTHGADCYDDDGNLICGQEEEPAHQHTDECYSWNQVLTCDQSTEAAQPVLTCEKDEIELHTHQPFVSEEDRGCYDAEGKNLVCGKPQVVEHQHTGACFKTVTEAVDTETLTCTLPEDETHTHTALCYGTWELTCGLEEHTHSEACTPTEPVYTCGKEAHTHSETCRDANGELICTLEEHTHSEECTAPEETTYCGKEAHTHSETCRDANGELICTLEEHTHSLACYSDPTADVETAEIWEQTFADVTLTGNWRQDAVSIAQTQLGYTESTKNYMVAEDGETVKGYTRYGAWYGDPYGDWDAMFVSFCLHYAGVEDVPMEADCGSWATAWADGFVPAQSHETAAGDLVFFDRDGDSAVDHAGLVTEVTDSGFTAIEGDAEDAVRLLSYGADDSTILGYVNLPEGAKEFTLTAQTETGITVTITGDSASVPYPAREITVTVKEVTDEESIAIRDQLLGEEAAEPEQSFLLDITLWHGEEEIEPTGPVTVTFSGFDTEGLYPEVYHIDTEAQTATDMEAEKEENGDVTVATDHFSMYAMVWRSAQPIKGFIGENTLANGGVFQLEDDAWTYEDGKNAQLTISEDTTIDLKGHILTISQSHQYFQVPNGVTLTIMDSATVSDSVSYPDGTLYGNRASLNDNTLTYYITTSTATADGTGTTEKLEKHEVNLSSVGRIVCSEASDQAVLVNGGTLKIQGGMLNSNNKGGRVVCVNSGTLTMEGGYLVGGSRDQGGGVYSNNNATVNISGGVIAANHANAGGGIYMNGGTVSISGGVISGNETTGNATTGNWDTGLGGGVFAQATTVTISGGYITNNRESSKCEQNGFGCHGGGGIATKGGSLTMEGGFVTGNYSAEAGGGMYVGHYNYGNPAAFGMTGGIVARNVAQESEGGGIRIAGGTTGVLSATDGKAYITNNRTDTPTDWGGGGIFIQENGNLTVINGLITKNSAGGYGGGVAACPSGKTLIVHKEGAAIFGNSDEGKKMSGGGNGKNDDSQVTEGNSTFINNGHKDYFCVKKNSSNPISLVTGEMPGGGAANWTGSCDGTPITISKTDYATANFLFGLAADPNQTDIDKAQSVARIIISGNRSNIHGGGIMTNGGLIIGRPEAGMVTATPALDISGTKALLVDGIAASSGRNFKFQLKDNNSNEVRTATADASTGKFTISLNTKYSETGTYTYTLSEVKGDRPGVTYDTSTYTIEVTIAEKDVTLLDVPFKSYYVDTVNVTKIGPDGSSSGSSSSGGSTGGGSSSGGSETSNTFKIHYQNSNGWSQVYLYTWNENGLTNHTDWPGMTVQEDPKNSGWYTQEFTVTGSGTFNYIFSNNGNSQTANRSGSYAPGTELWVNADGSETGKPDGWVGGSTSSEGTTTPSGEVTLHFNNYGNWNEVALHVWGASGVNASGYDGGWPGGQVSADAAHTGWYTASIPVTGTTGSFGFNFNNNGKGSQTRDFQPGEIGGGEFWITDHDTILTVAPAGWSVRSTPSSDFSITVVKNSDVSYSLTINGNAFTNTITSITPMNLQILKTDSNDTSKRLEGATFLLKQESAETGTEAITGKNGIATFEGIGRNTTYYLYETTPPDNYMTAGPWILEVKESTATLYPAAEGDNGTLTKTSETGTALNVSGSNPIVLTATISDQPWGYELPNTGGAGTQPYTMGGIALMAAAVMFLLYSHTRRRKEDAPSS